MAEINVQIQPHLLAAFDETAVERLCSAEAFRALIQDVSKNEGHDQGRYINVFFTTDNPKQFWVALLVQLVQLGLQGASIVTRTGKDGWNDYLLLHHFDPQHRTGEARAL